MNRIYLDYNASTPLDPRVKLEMTNAIEIYGNPSSIHAEGREARALVDEARVQVAALLQCDHRQLVFTSGGTESNNLAILGSARANRKKGNHIITTAIEHSAVLNACHQLEKEGFEIDFISPTPQGIIEWESIAKAIRSQTILITVMMANNEVGTIQAISEIARMAHERGIPVHTDAVQALGKIPVSVPDLGVDLLSISAHKIYGPKGAGALYFAPGLDLSPLMLGGSHEKGFRAGTENVLGIHGFGVAARILHEEGLPDVLPLRQNLEAGLSKTSMKIICGEALRLPNTVNFYSYAWLGESMVMAFDLEGIAVSNGSACSSGIIEPSHVIRALGYNEEVARSVIRVSFGKFTTAEEIQYLLRVIHHFENIGSGVAK
jgi:cysteine desulfurase